MAPQKEETMLERAEKELAGFIAKKTEVETLVKEKLAKAKLEYDAIVSKINAEHNVGIIDFNIAVHSHIVNVLKGETAVPIEKGAKISKAAKASAPKEKTRVADWSSKIVAALSKLGKTVSDNPTPKTIKAALIELYPDLEFNDGAFNNAWNNYKTKNK